MRAMTPMMNTTKKTKRRCSSLLDKPEVCIRLAPGINRAWIFFGRGVAAQIRAREFVKVCDEKSHTPLQLTYSNVWGDDVKEHVLRVYRDAIRKHVMDEEDHPFQFKP